MKDIMDRVIVICAMKALLEKKEKAISLRRMGLSYKEILQKIPVAKSSLSLWLKDLPLTEEEKDILRKRTDSNISRGRIKSAAANRNNRLLREKEQLKVAREEFNLLKEEPMFLCGISLYWAEGSKRSSGFQFTNSDPEMIKFMVLWCRSYFKKQEKIYLRLYNHKPYAHENCEKFWSNITDIPLADFKKTVYKPSNLGVKKRPGYRGCIRIEIPKSMHLLRKMQFWKNMLLDYLNKRVVL